MTLEEGPALRGLLDALAGGQVPADSRLGEWQISPVAGGANNRLYHVQGPDGDLAIKFCLRDRRQRAAREHGALRALDEAGLKVAPRPRPARHDPLHSPGRGAGVAAGAGFPRTSRG